MINQLEILIKEIIENINKDKFKTSVDFEKYKEYVLKYVKKIDDELIENTYEVLVFETIYINILTIMIQEIIKTKYNIDIEHNILLNRIDENAIFCGYILDKKYVNKTKSLLSNKEKINLKFFTDFYEKNINKQYKKILGQFYTPSTIVKEMLKGIRVNETMYILDPSCGAGIFLTEIIEKYSKNKSEENVINFVNNNLCANDINPFAIVMTKINIIIEIINITKDANIIYKFLRENNILSNIKLKDTLKCSQDNMRYNLIIGNPPFFKMTKEQINEYQNDYTQIYGQTNIYEMFVHWALKNIQKNGNIKYIIPQSFKSGLYFKNLRKEMSKYYIASIININNTKKIFCDVEQAVLIINIKNIKPTNKKTEIKSFDVINNTFNNKYLIENEKLFNKENDSYEINIAQSKEEYSIIEKISNNPDIKTLKELKYKFANGLFVWNQNKDIIENERTNNIPIIYSDYIEKEKFDFDIFLRNDDKKQFCKKNEKSTRYSLSGQRLIIQRTSTFSQKNRLNAAIISQNFLYKYKYYLLENHVNHLIFNNDKDKIIEEKKLYFFWAIINSDLINWIFKIKSGNTQISSTELNLLPICPYEEKIYKLAKEYSSNANDEIREKLQEEIYIKYGLNNEEIAVVKGR